MLLPTFSHPGAAAIMRTLARREGWPVYRATLLFAPALLEYFGDDPRADGMAALADRELEPLLHGDGSDQLARDGDVIAGHHHLDALGQVHDPGHVRRPEVE